MSKFNPMRRRIPLLKRWVPSVRKRLALLTWTDGFAVVRSGGARFLLNVRNFVDRQIAFYDDYEAEQVAYLVENIRRHDCTIFVDVGANLGYYSVQVARRTSVARVIAFEPDARNFDQLRANLFLNGLSTRVETLQVAVSDHAGKVAFQAFPDTSTGQSRVAESGAGTPIEAVRLDDVVKLERARLAIKIDIEGHELAAIAGMRDLLTRNRCLIQAEVFEEKLAAFKATLESLGYREIHVIDPEHYFANFD